MCELAQGQQSALHCTYLQFLANLCATFGSMIHAIHVLVGKFKVN